MAVTDCSTQFNGFLKQELIPILADFGKTFNHAAAKRTRACLDLNQ